MSEDVQLQTNTFLESFECRRGSQRSVRFIVFVVYKNCVLIQKVRRQPTKAYIGIRCSRRKVLTRNVQAAKEHAIVYHFVPSKVQRWFPKYNEVG